MAAGRSRHRASTRGTQGVPGITVAVVGCFVGSVEDYQAQYAAWVLEVRPERCPHCGAEHTCIFWGSYARWVRLTTHRMSIRIERVRCTVCHVTDALLPSFLHMFRHYAMFLIQKTIIVAIDAGLWGDELADAVGPFNQPAPSTIREWVWFYALSAEWLLPWIQHKLLAFDPLLAIELDRPPDHLQAIRNPKRRAAFTRAWQTLRLAKSLYAAARARQTDLAFQADMLLAFVAAALGATGRVPRLLWPQAAARAPA